MSVVRALPAGVFAAGFVAVGSGTAFSTAISVVAVLAMLLVFRTVRFQLRGALSSSGRHHRTES